MWNTENKHLQHRPSNDVLEQFIKASSVLHKKSAGRALVDADEAERVCKTF
jgi:hypothetical protein